MDDQQRAFINGLTYSKDYWEGFKAGCAVRLNKSSPNRIARYYDQNIADKINALAGSLCNKETDDIARQIGYKLGEFKGGTDRRILCNHIRACGYIRFKKRAGRDVLWLWKLP